MFYQELDPEVRPPVKIGPPRRRARLADTISDAREVIADTRDIIADTRGMLAGIRRTIFANVRQTDDDDDDDNGPLTLNSNPKVGYRLLTTSYP